MGEGRTRFHTGQPCFPNQIEFNVAEAVFVMYKRLWLVERAFRKLKSQLKLRPMYHWSDERIRGHVMICFLAFYLECRFRQLLQAARPDLDYSQILEPLRTLCTMCMCRLPLTVECSDKHGGLIHYIAVEEV